MAQNVSYNGQSYVVPDVNDTVWGASLTAYLVALSTGSLQKSGGLFTLTAEADFGATFGLRAAYFASRLANIAQSGVFRLPNAQGIAWRNAANNADLLLQVDSANNLVFNGNVVPIAALGAANTVLQSNGTTTLYALINDANIAALADIAIGKLNGGTANRLIASSGASNRLAALAAIAAGHVLFADSNGLPVGEAQLAVTRGGLNLSGIAAGELPVGSGANTYSRLAAGVSGQYLRSNGAAAPSWQTFTQPTVQRFTATGTTTGYLFTISTSSTVAAGDTYSHNSNTYTVLYALSAQSGQVLYVSGAGAPLASGTLTRVTGAGTASISFTSSIATATYTTAAGAVRLRVRKVGGGGGGGGNNTGAGNSPGTAGGDTVFGQAISKGGARGLSGNADSRPTGTTAGPYTLVQIYPGQEGGSGGQCPTTANGTAQAGGTGGSSFLGGGARGNAGGNGRPAEANTGGGGGGGSSQTAVNSDFAGSGGSGGDGVELLINGPAATYPYAVGAGGPGNTSAANDGGNGGSGLIIVEEFYQ